MSKITDIQTLYKFLLQQMAAESYFEGISLTTEAAVKRALRLGTNREGYQDGPPDLNGGYPGFTRMTEVMADEFLKNFEVVHQWSDNPSTGNPPGSRPAEEGIDGKPKLNSADILANTDFSATLIRARDANGVLTGEYNSGNNALNGGTGTDTMQGGAGDDTYVVDNVGGVVVENAGEGTDLVQSKVTYTMGAGVENLTLTGTSAINGNAGWKSGRRCFDRRYRQRHLQAWPWLRCRHHHRERRHRWQHRCSLV